METLCSLGRDLVRNKKTIDKQRRILNKIKENRRKNNSVQSLPRNNKSPTYNIKKVANNLSNNNSLKNIKNNIVFKKNSVNKKINFIMTGIYYSNVVETMMKPIVKHLKEYETSNITKDNCINVHFFNEHSHLKNTGLNGINVMIPHGLADKAWRNATKENQFDYVTASSDLWKDILVQRGIKSNKIIVCGYPKIDLFYDIEKKENNKKTVLWCPTHNTNLKNLNCTSSNPGFRKFIKSIPDKYNFIEHVHPYNHTEHNATCEDLVNSDVIISDFSSMIYEGIIIGKPVIFPDWIVKNVILSHYKNTVEGKMYIENIGLHANDIDELLIHIENAIKDGLDQKTKDFAEQILPTKFRGKSGKYIAEFLMSI